MKKVVLSLIVLCFGISTKTFAQTDDDKAFSLSVGLNQDAFFGFYPTVAGSYLVSNKVDFTFYGILWGGGTGAAWGQWTEFGMGANFKSGNLDINPQLGFTMGNLLSSYTAQRGVAGDGIVPNLTVNYGDALFEGQFYGGYYAAFRNTASSGQNTANYTHYWVNAGVKVLKFASIGAHFEDLGFAGGKVTEGPELEASNVYRWLGPYVQFSAPNGSSTFRFSFGGDITDKKSNSDFYKISVGFNF
jgi:hypothetical protein